MIFYFLEKYGSFSGVKILINFVLNFFICRNIGLVGKDDDFVVFFFFDDDWYGFLLLYVL